MLEEETDFDGGLKHGRILCDNKKCRNIIYEWFDKNDTPDEDRASFYAYVVKTRIFFNHHPTRLAMASTEPTYVFTMEDKHIGYILDYKALIRKLDFCSLECSARWLEGNQTEVVGNDYQPLKEKLAYGVMLHGQFSQKNFRLIVDNPSNFRTIHIGNFLPTSAPQNQIKLPVGQKIIIAGKIFEVRRSNTMVSGQKEPSLGVVMTTLSLKCPMKLNQTTQTCGQTINIIVDFAPSVWICPNCHGIIVLDNATNNSKHTRANARTNIEVGNTGIIANYYFGKLDWGDKNFLDWISNYLETEMIIVADAYQDTGFFGNMFVADSLINLDEVVNLFENF